MKLRDVLPKEFFDEFHDSKANKYLDVEVSRTYEHGGWPGSHKNILNWWKLENGYAIGWNENPSRGWSFPVMKLTNNTNHR